MPAYSFSVASFRTDIPLGLKVRTTRLFKDGKRFRQAVKAQGNNVPASLYWKQRTKESELLLRSPIEEVNIVKFERIGGSSSSIDIMALIVDGQERSEYHRELYAKEEGFRSNEETDGWQSFVKTLSDIHGEDFWKDHYYSIKWAKPEKVR